MRRILLFSIVAAAALAMGMGMGGAIAQEDAAENDSANASVEYEAEFNDYLRVTDYELEDGTARITFEADRLYTVSVTDAMDGIGSDGIVSPHSREYELERGETTIEMDVTELRGGSSVSVSASGKTARLSSKFEEQEPHDPLQYFSGISGLFTGIFMSTGLAGAAAYYVVKREDSGVIEA